VHLAIAVCRSQSSAIRPASRVTPLADIRKTCGDSDLEDAHLGWETRGRGHYYYELERRGGRTVRRYIGGGSRGALQAKTDTLLRERRLAHQKAWRTRRVELAEGDDVLKQLSMQLRVLSEALLLSHGFCRLRGRWRRHRVE
jgi:hypothetical protein